ncbi:acyl-[acyl-carrier-protein]--UDP-N-acetylglucosamine O-acyltransferase [Candidatus Termititenax dinenymphae]|uniref:Acyl-[acyl-carrier-protein]--UDP-N-acetylglucosamine O-acyltransferase n=1 Tax=Candidatus Termititenax dinenymphae TaxID=2218523 RepID=A0A388TJV0_9BACT|nr:acyl-[acyl-carrier-protein]--UDP-N-acetylglucosamine O-acyltransferase [Candidatus Termititenax dinenymphae]
MPQQIHQTACIDPTAKLGENVIIGPYTIVEAQAQIGDRTEIAANVTIGEGTIIGTDNEICRGAIIGGKPQDISYQGEKSNVIIGSGNKIREYATIHKATGEGKSTVVGDNNFIMSFVHLAHNVHLGSNIVLVNMVQLAGHVIVEDNATLGGMVAVPQFLRIGKLAMIGGYSRLFQDVPPFMLAEGNPAEVYSINKVGLRRNPQIASPESIPLIKEAYKIIYRQGKNISQAVEAIGKECRINGELPEQIEHLLEFLQASKKGISRSAQKPRELLQTENSGLTETQPFFEKMRDALNKKIHRVSK